MTLFYDQDDHATRKFEALSDAFAIQRSMVGIEGHPDTHPVLVERWAGYDEVLKENADVLSDHPRFKHDYERHVAEQYFADQAADLEQVANEDFRGYGDYVSDFELAREAVKADPLFPRVEEEMMRYASFQKGGMALSEDGSCYWVPECSDPVAAARALDAIADVRRELLARHPGWAVNNVIGFVADEELVTVDYEPGLDCDRMTHYEPYGNPTTAVDDRMRFEASCDEYNAMDDAELMAKRDAWSGQYDEEGRADNFYTMATMRKDKVAMDHVIRTRRLDAPSRAQGIEW